MGNGSAQSKPDGRLAENIVYVARALRAAGIPVGPGRGSGAGSLVAWALTITDLDPMRFGLLFERFLNPERVSMPDIDIDFSVRGRERVIRYVTEKYGRESVAQIVTFGKMFPRAATRDAGPFGPRNTIEQPSCPPDM